MKLLTTALLLAIASAGAKDKRTLSNEEMLSAYSVSVNRISTILTKAPSTASYAPIDQARFSPARRDSIDVTIFVDAQNSYGAMLRENYSCRVGPHRPDGLYNVFCYSRGRY